MMNSNPDDVVQKARWLALALAVGTFALFAPAIGYEYLDYDDGIYVYGNKDVLRGLTTSSLRYAFTSITGGSWMPLTWLSHMLDVSLFGQTPAGPHAMNIALHALSAALLLLVLHRMTGKLWPSVFTAILFAFHPLRNESVIWIAERKDVLSTLLWMAGMFAYVRYVNESKVRGSRAKIFYALTLLCLALGLMAKPMLVTFPFALLLLDFWPLNRLGTDWQSLRHNLWPRLREKIVLFVLAALMCVGTFWSQLQVGAMDPNDGTLLEHAATVVGNYGFYVEKIFIPVNPCILYPTRTTPIAGAAVIASVFVVVTIVALRCAFRLPWLAMGWFWFLGTLVPVVGIVRVGHISVAERYTYLPSIGLTLAVVWLIAGWVRDRIALQKAAAAFGVVAAAACVVITRADLPRWKNSIVLFQSAINTHPHPVSFNNIAVCYLDRHDYALAIEPLTRAIQMDTNYLKAFINRAIAYEKTGRFDEARSDYERLLKIEPHNAEGFNNRADVLLDMGRLDEAIRDFSSAIQLEPESAAAYNNRASARLMKDDLAGAINDASKAIELAPLYANAFNTRGNCYNRRKEFARALADYDRAITLSPNDPLAYNNRAAIHLQLKQYDKAWSDIRQCKALGGTPHEGLVRALTEASVKNP